MQPFFLTSDEEIFMIYIFVRVGSIHENSKLAGVSHCVEHMIFKSSESYDTKAILKTLTLVGSNYNATTTRDLTYYYIHTTSQGTRWKDAAKLLLSMVFAPRLQATEWERERGVVLEELAMSARQEEDDANIMKTLLSSSNPYTNLIGGSYETVKRITASDLQKHHATYYYDPERVSIVVSCPAKMQNAVKALFKDICCGWQQSTQPTIKSSQDLERPLTIIPRCLFKNKANEESVKVFLTFPTYNIREWRKLAAQNLLTHCLTQSALFSILMYELREKRGLVYTVKSGIETYDHISVNKIVFSTQRTDKIIYIIELIARLIKTIQKVGLERETFRFYKESYLNTLKYLMTNYEYYFLNCAFNHNYGVETVSRTDYIKFIEKLSNHDIQRAAKDTYDFAKMGIYVTGNLKGVNKSSITVLQTKYANKV